MVADNSVELDPAGILVRCESCRQRNRLKFGTLGNESRCGRCKTPLALPSTPINVDSPEHFRSMVGSSVLPILIDFWASWCGPCKMVAPELEKVAASAQGQFLVAKVNTDELQEIAAQFQISSIPTLCVMHRGREIRRQAGAASAPAILAFVRQTIGVN